MTIILIAMPSDHFRVRNIVGALSESDLDIFWDRTAPGTREWREAAKRVMAARGVVFFWSTAAAGPDARPYRKLAQQAGAAGKAICVRLDGEPIPDRLMGWATYDMRGWRARASSLFMLDLVAAVQAKAAGLDPPLPRAPRQLLLRRLAIAIPTALAIIAAFATILGLYRDLGIDNIPNSAERQAWAAIRPGSCEDLRGFLRAHSGGVQAAEAQALLDARAARTETRWHPAQRPLPLYIPIGSEQGSPNERAARSDARERAVPVAERRCRALAQTASARFLSASVRIEAQTCERFASGTACDLRGEAICQLEEPREISIETCSRS